MENPLSDEPAVSFLEIHHYYCIIHTTTALYTLLLHLDFIDWDLIAGMYLII